MSTSRSIPSAWVDSIVEGRGESLGGVDRDAIAEALADKLAQLPADSSHGDTGDFVAHIGAVLPGYKPPEVEIQRLEIRDLALAHGCALGDAAALADFDARLLPLVEAAGRKLKLATGQIDELRQQVRVRLLVGDDKGAPRIASYAGTGPLRSWVYATSVRTGLNMLRSAGRRPAGDDELLASIPETDDDPRLRYMKQLYRDEFRRAFKESVAELPDREANVLRHYHLDELTLEQIGAIYRVHKTTTMRWLNRAHARLEADVRQRMTTGLELGETELESVLRLIRSGIHVSLASVLGEPDKG